MSEGEFSMKGPYQADMSFQRKRKSEQACVTVVFVYLYHHMIMLDAWIRLTFSETQIPFDPMTLASIPNSSKIHH